MSQTIGILGGKGFIGSHLLRTLAVAGHNAFSIPTPDCGDELVDHFRQVAGRCDWIVHSASATRPSTSDGKPSVELEQNLRTTLALVEALQTSRECRLLYISSGGTVYGPTVEKPAGEEQLPHPANYYGAGKIAAEMFLHALCNQYDRSAVIIRPTNVYGPGQLPRPGFGLIPTAFFCCIRGETISLYGDGESVRDYLYVDDLCQLMVAVISSRGIQEGVRTFNAASGRGFTVREILEAVEVASGIKIARRHVPARRLDARSVLLDATAAHASFGWGPSTSLSDGLANTWQWIKEGVQNSV